MEIKGEGLPTGDVKKLLSKSYDKTQSSYGDYQIDIGYVFSYIEMVKLEKRLWSIAEL